MKECSFISQKAEKAFRHIVTCHNKTSDMNFLYIIRCFYVFRLYYRKIDRMAENLLTDEREFLLKFNTVF